METDINILVTGANGQLGNELRKLLGDKAIYHTRHDFDLTDRRAVEDYLRAHNFKYVVNCAAYTAVDLAEEEKALCSAANIDAVENLARLSDELGYNIIHISTDYVFSGNAYKPYSEGARPEPLSVYGATKRKGETALLGLAPQSVIIRTGWLYSSFGHNFVKTILGKLQQNATLHVVDDQIGTPTYAADLAQFITEKVIRGHWAPGIYHFSNEGVASWYDFAIAIAEESGYADATIHPIHSDDYPTAAVRPRYAVLDKSKVKATFGIGIEHWRKALRRCLYSLNNTING